MNAKVERDIGLAVVTKPNKEWSEPTHSNAWGALIMNAVRQNLLTPTGRYLQSRTKANHAHSYKEYMKGK